MKLKPMSECLQELREREAHMDKVFVFSQDKTTITINIVIVYPYEIELNRIPDHEALLGWMLQLGEKTWMNSSHLVEFAERVMKIKGWKRRLL